MNNITLTKINPRLIKKKIVIPFHKQVCSQCHKIPHSKVSLDHDCNYYSAIEIFFLKFREYFLKIVVFILLMLEEFSGVARIKAVRGDEYSVYR